jgi:hypothetical protein
MPTDRCSTRASRAWRALLLLCLGFFVGAAPSLAQDDPPGRVGRLAALQGEAWVFDHEQGDWAAALLNRPITSGDRIATAEGASLELQIGSTTLLLGGQTEFEVLRLDDERMQFRLQRGRLALLLRSAEVAAELELLHPEARFQPLRAGLYRIDRLAEASDAVVQRGELQVRGHNLSMTLHAGQRAAFWREGALGDTTRQWLMAQEDDFTLLVQRYEQAARTAAAPLLPAEMTGIQDLDRHGQWQQHPEFGVVWSPTVVAVGWAPFRHGQWVWLRPWGWTWVDAAPWGFAPSHYGRWLWWGNRWCWTPGSHVRRPVFAPGLVGWVGPPPAVHAGKRPLPGAGWVPLGPREPFQPGYRASPGHVQRLNPQLPPGWQAPTGHVHRQVPGALTQWSGPFHGPARPQRETMTPRPAQPLAVPAPRPTQAVAAVSGPPAAVSPPAPAAPTAPRARPPMPAPAVATPQAAFQGRAAQVAPPAPAAPVAAAAPAPGAAPAERPAPRSDIPNGRQAQDPGERRRTPESRYTPRER